VKFLLADEQGASKLEVSSEFWFWTLLMTLGATLYIFISHKYTVNELLQDEKITRTKDN